MLNAWVSQEMQAQLGLSKQTAQSVTVIEQGRGAATRRIAQQRPGEHASCETTCPVLHVRALRARKSMHACVYARVRARCARDDSLNDVPAARTGRRAGKGSSSPSTSTADEILGHRRRQPPARQGARRLLLSAPTRSCVWARRASMPDFSFFFL